MAEMIAKCRELRAEPLAVGVMPDHAHLLVRLPAALSVATLVKEVKGASSHLVNHAIAPGSGFKWQGAYGAFTLAKEGVPALIEYIRSQQQHHEKIGTAAEWEILDEPKSGS